MRFESKLRESKLYTHNIHSRINPPCSNAKKAALKFAKFLINHEVAVEPIFSFSNSLNVALKNIDYFTRIVSCEKNNTLFQICHLFKQVTYKGTIYMTKYFLVAREVHTKLFKILSFLNFGNNVFVVCAEINLLSYDNHFCAYQVGNSTENVYVKIIQEYKAEVCITYVCTYYKTKLC